MKNSRIYPLRTVSSIWKIKLYSKHICNEMCKFAYIQEDIVDRTSIMFIIDNPDYIDGKCPFSMKLNTSSVQISTFNKTDPYTIDGELLFYKNIVIPDTQIYLNISFPLKEQKNIRITSDNPLGFSLSYLINKIKNVYKWVYEEEENTSSINTFTIVDQCDKCNFGQIKDPEIIMNSISDISNDNNVINDDKCSICLETLMFNSKMTICNHKFHKDCIYEWIKNDKNTCPLCRTNLSTCSNCNNGLIFTKYIGKVIPKNMRGILNRNQSDGVFGIYGYDFDDLFIDEMVYNKNTKVLYPKIFG